MKYLNPVCIHCRWHFVSSYWYDDHPHRCNIGGKWNWYADQDPVTGKITRGIEHANVEKCDNKNCTGLCKDYVPKFPWNILAKLRGDFIP